MAELGLGKQSDLVRFLAGARRQESTCSDAGGTIWSTTHGLHTQNIPVELGTGAWISDMKTDMMNTYIAATIFTHIQRMESLPKDCFTAFEPQLLRRSQSVKVDVLRADLVALNLSEAS